MSKRRQNRGNRNRGVSNIKGNSYKPSTAQKVSTYSPVPKGKATYCDHWQGIFTFGEGLEIVVSSTFGMPGKYLQVDASDPMRLPIDFGFYLDDGWLDRTDLVVTPGIDLPFMQKGTAKVIYPWQDYGTPDSIRMFEASLRWLREEIKSGKMVETGCMGGHGRTGTLLACLLVLEGEEASAAIKRVKTQHCIKAVETIDQQNFVRKFDRQVNGREYHPVHAPRIPTTTSYNEKTGKWVPAPKSWTDGMTPATRLDAAMDADVRAGVAFVRDHNDDDGEDYEKWWHLNAAGIAASLDRQDWPRRGSMHSGFSQDDPVECHYPPCPHVNECNAMGEDCFRAEMWGPADEEDESI